MKEEKVYVFYPNEDVGEELKKGLNIRPDEERASTTPNGKFEMGNSPIETQLKELKWSDIGIGRYGMVFFMEVLGVGDEDEARLSIEKAHIIIRHKSKEEIREESEKDIQKALTLLDQTDTI
jgi:hypothetical protein